MKKEILYLSDCNGIYITTNISIPLVIYFIFWIIIN